MKIKFLKTVGNNNYFVADIGIVVSLRILKPYSNGKDYQKIKIGNKSYYVHRLVYEKFGKKKMKKGLHVNHNDKIRDNNDIENLDLVTPIENIIHRDQKTPF